MISKHLSSLAVSTAILFLALAALACTTQIAGGPTPVPSVVIETATTAPLSAITPAAPVNSPTPTALVPSATPAPLRPTATVTATTAVTGTIKQTTNIRSGPGVDYALLGNLMPGLPVQLTGRTADKSWWQIEFSASPDGRGWVVATNLDLIATANADALPIASAPPLPTRPLAQATATLAPGTIPVLRADKAELAAGECTTLRWDIENVQAVFLNSGSGEMPVAGHDTLVICPDDTYTYSLRVVNKNDTVQHFTYTVKVAGCGSAPIISRFEASETEIKVGEKVTIAWAVSCAQAVYFKDGDNQRVPVAGHDEDEFQPNKTTTYKLIVFGKDGSRIDKEITVKVVP